MNPFLKHYLPPKEVFDYLDLNVQHLDPKQQNLYELFKKDLINYNEIYQLNDLENILTLLGKKPYNSVILNFLNLYTEDTNFHRALNKELANCRFNTFDTFMKILFWERFTLKQYVLSGNQLNFNLIYQNLNCLENYIDPQVTKNIKKNIFLIFLNNILLDLSTVGHQ